MIVVGTYRRVGDGNSVKSAEFLRDRVLPGAEIEPVTTLDELTAIINNGEEIDTLVFLGHGWGDGMILGSPQVKGQWFTTKEFKKRIKQGRIRKGIWAFWCEPGRKFAQITADHFGVIVIGSRHSITTGENYGPILHLDKNPGAKWYQFHPGKSEPTVFSSVDNFIMAVNGTLKAK